MSRVVACAIQTLVCERLANHTIPQHRRLKCISQVAHLSCTRGTPSRTIVSKRNSNQSQTRGERHTVRHVVHKTIDLTNNTTSKLRRVDIKQKLTRRCSRNKYIYIHIYFVRQWAAPRPNQGTFRGRWTYRILLFSV